ncbi:class I SAM-dependent methyltransferase [Pyxidicoccus caerfyrddinensis]|uniref:class I SAM-dependent methyltransferase n=1 Tax=Pyxidicoccus caerfyrddinensis TaxID=2709663 RepID=UPI0013D9DD2F|nr:class I SAM-dependent methyltransferase [Pyxidicoccus caerfyrddinensis]
MTVSPSVRVPDELWRTWRARWDRFQSAYVPQREQQWHLMGEYVSSYWPRPGLRVLDLASGPGAMGVALLAQRPDAEVVCLDVDPWLLEMGRRTMACEPRVTWVAGDLRDRDWPAAIPAGGFHAVVTGAVLHWLERDELASIYRGVHVLLVDGGMLLCSDVLPTGTQRIGNAARGMLQRQLADQAPAGGESWHSFWSGAEAEPAFRELLELRAQRLGPRRPRVFPPIDAHLELLAEAGFRDLGEIWRLHEYAILLAIR